MNTVNHVITFALDGTAHCLWTEAVPLQELGVLDVRRASQVEFNPSKQEWEVRLISGPSKSPNIIAIPGTSTWFN
jgi:hypothetical protein